MATESERERDYAVVVDAREIDGGPFDEIVAALDDLGRDEELLLINPFEPEPLYDVLETRGFDHETTRVDDAFHVEISRA